MMCAAYTACSVVKAFWYLWHWPWGWHRYPPIKPRLNRCLSMKALAVWTLKPETLDIAIASLDALQALGRKVGVISHVPILVERIGAKVVVEKQGRGQYR